MEKEAFVVGLVAGIVVAVALLSLNINPQKQGSTSAPSIPPLSTELAELSLDNFSAVGVQISRPFIVLVRQDNASCNSTLSAITDELQLASIERALIGGVDARPSPHELMADSLRLFGIETVMVRIDRLEGTAYLSSLILRKGQQLLALDARPSDAIAIALRANATTYIKTNLFEQNARTVCK